MMRGNGMRHKKKRQMLFHSFNFLFVGFLCDYEVRNKGISRSAAAEKIEFIEFIKIVDLESTPNF